jgi:hypothetical protein
MKEGHDCFPPLAGSHPKGQSGTRERPGVTYALFCIRAGEEWNKRENVLKIKLTV